MASTNATIRAEMARHKVTQAALAEALGMTQPAVSARLHGRIDWRLGELITAAALLQVPVSDLVDDPSPAEAAASTT